MNKVKIRSEMKAFLAKQQGSVMMEYIVITSVFMLAIGGFVYWDSKYVNLLPGLQPGRAHSFERIAEREGYLTYRPVPKKHHEVLRYGAVGNAFAAQTQKAQKVIAMPQL